MRISHIGLTDFRSHSASNVGMDHINVFVGRNNSGKSSIKAAIEYALIGRCEWTDGAGRGAENLIRDGATSAAVNMGVEGLGLISRSIPGELHVGDWAGGTKMQQAQLYQELHAGADEISAALNTGRFLSLKPDEQKNMLFNLMGLRFDEQKITEALEKYMADVRKGDMLTAGFYSYLKPFLARAGAGGPEVLDTLHSALYKERTAAKKSLKELEALARAPAAGSQAQALPPEVRQALADPQKLEQLKQHIRQQLQGLKNRKEELIQKRGQVMGRGELIERLKRQYQELLDNYDATYKELLEIMFDQAQLDGLESALPALKKKADGARGSLDLQKNLAGSHKANLDAWIAARDTLKKNQHDRRCPLAPELSCTADVKEMLAKVERDIDAVAGHLDRANHEATILENNAKEALRQYEEVLARAEELRQVRDEQVRLAEDIKEVDRQKEATRAELDEARKETDSIESIEGEINQLSQRIIKGEELQRIVAEEALLRTERNRMSGTLDKHRQEVAWLEALVEAFGPKGMKGTMLTEIIDKLQGRANERLSRLTNGEYKLRFDLESGFGIKVSVAGGPEKNVSLLSTSERMRVGIVLQDTLNSLTGLRLLVIDDCEILDPQNKSMLISLLMGVRYDYDTIIILSALGETQPRNPGIPGLSVFMVDGGTIRAIEAPEASAA